jgi:hypothetical protein
MMIAKFSLVVIKNLMKYKATNKLSRARICQEMRTQVPARRKAADRGHTAPEAPSPFRAN